MSGDPPLPIVHPPGCMCHGCCTVGLIYPTLPETAAPDVLTVEQAARFLQVGRSTLYDAIGRGEVPYRRIGRHIRLSRGALVRWFEGSCGAASKKVGS